MPIDNTYIYNPLHSNLYLSEWDMPYNWNYKSAVVSNAGWMPSYELNNGTWVNLFGEPVGPPEGISLEGTPDLSWHQDWLGNRLQLLLNNMNDTALFGRTYNADDAYNTFQEEINNLKGYKEYIPAPGTYNWKEGLAGITEYGPREINYNPLDLQFIHYPSSIIIHERTHALDSPEGGVTKRHIPLLNMIDLIMHDTYGKGWIYDPEYKEEFGGDSYVDNPNEIYSRMMSIRHDASLNPNDVLDRDALEKLRKDPRVTDYDKERTLNRYDDDTLLRLFNEVAQNNTDNNMINYASYGGNLYAKGGSIHINPKNRGKFNATKKRTGKTTEELTHSKNPLTRKRAIFALNFGGHKKENGGYIQNSNYQVGKEYYLDEAEIYNLIKLGYGIEYL